MEKSEEKKRIGILRGGAGDYYENSLQEGGEFVSFIYENLLDKYKVLDIFIEKEGLWHIGGLPIQPIDLVNRVDFVWNLTNPNYSNIFKIFSVPHITSNFFTTDNKESRALLEEQTKDIGINMPRHLVLPIYQKDFDGPAEEYAIKKAKEVHGKFPAPWIVRSLNSNPNLGVHIAKTFPELIDAITDVVSHNDSILVEELISGKNAFMHTVNGFRRDLSAQAGDIYVFPPIGNFSKDEKEKLINLAQKLHQHFDKPNYLKSNFVLHPKKGIYLTSVEFYPDLKKDSHFDKMCESVGTKAHKLVEHIIESVL